MLASEQEEDGHVVEEEDEEGAIKDPGTELVSTKSSLVQVQDTVSVAQELAASCLGFHCCRLCNIFLYCGLSIIRDSGHVV